ncbi:MAG: hypothetical protein KHZ65_15180 [Phocaeicola vulgatus]|nr:hypothetical protein [Phocaeicola vulgatus]
MATSNRKRSRKSRGETIRSGLGNMKDLSVHRHKTAPVPAGGRYTLHRGKYYRTKIRQKACATYRYRCLYPAREMRERRGKGKMAEVCLETKRRSRLCMSGRSI